MITIFACKCGKEYENNSSYDELPGAAHECVICGEIGCEGCLRTLPNSHDWVHREHTESEIHDFEILHEG